MKTTAVEFLVEMLLGNVELSSLEKIYIEQAKEMEKEQIIDAYAEAENNCEWLIEEHKWQRFHSEQYYNETFKK
jgi:hypothetical protein